MFVRIPADRVGVLLGKEGATKKTIEKATSCSITLEENDAIVEGNAVDEVRAADIVKAIGRGFTPKQAMQLMDDGTELVVISLEGQTDNTVKRLMARVIGQEGKSRKYIERMTGAKVVVKGKTVAIIGGFEEARVARKAVDMLIEGRTHAYVWKMMGRMLKDGGSEGML